MLYGFTEAQLQETEKLETIRNIRLTSSYQKHSFFFKQRQLADQETVTNSKVSFQYCDQW